MPAPARRVAAADPDSALELAEEVLGRALRIGATEAEVLVTAGDSSLTRFANSEIHQNVAERGVSVNLRYIVGKRIAVVSTGKIDPDGLRTLVHRAAAIARSCEELPDWAGLPGPTGLATGAPSALDPAARAAAASSAAGGARIEPSSLGWCEATAAATPEFRAEGVRAVIAAADAAGVMAYGAFTTEAEAMAVANSAGIRAAERRTSSQLLTVQMSPDGGTGYAEGVSRDATTIDAAAIGREAATKARASD
ncbi:MAG TPA: DNA gyrase modulator, partial [Candidatus Limnocylindrales bacterium]|nr:DNA gyrase modulator [Candidatus Limnocylindrales bacterium]